MKRILLINPWIYDFAAYDLWMKPLGLLYLASILRNNGFHVDFLDCLDPYCYDSETEGHLKPPKRQPSGRGHFPKEQIAKPSCLKEIKRRYYRFGISPHLFRATLEKKPAPDMIFVTSMMTYWYPGVFAAIETLHDLFPGIPIILGGNYATLCTAHAQAFSGADEIVRGEGEKSLPGIIKKYLGYDLPLAVDYLNLNSLPYPAFDLLSPIEQLPVLVSRGCPYRCTYCASGIINSEGYRSRNPLQVVDEIEFWQRRYSVRHFAFYDDALLVNPQASIIPLLHELMRRELNCSFHCPNGLHLREISGELASLMYQAGFRTLRFGFETSDFARQVATGGKANTDHLRKAARHLIEAGYAPGDIGVYLLCGLPGQNASEIYQSIEMVRSYGCRPVLAEYSPIPGTALWHDAVKASPWDISEEPLYHNNTILPCRDQSLTDVVYHDLKKLTRLPFAGSE